MRRKMLCGIIAAAMCVTAAASGLSFAKKTTASAAEPEYDKVYDFTSITDVSEVVDFSVGIDPYTNNTELGYTSDGWVTYQRDMTDIFSVDNGLRVKTGVYSGDDVSENNLYVRVNNKKAAYFKAELVYTYNSEERNGWAGFMFGYSNYDRKARWGDSASGVEIFTQKGGKGTFSSAKLNESNYTEGPSLENWTTVAEHTLTLSVNTAGVTLVADGQDAVSISKELMAEKNYTLANESFGFYLTNGDFTVKSFSYTLTDENGNVGGSHVTDIEVASEVTVSAYEPLNLNAKAIPENATIKTLKYELPEGAVERDGKLYFGKAGVYDVIVRSEDVESVYKTVKVTVTAGDKLVDYGVTSENVGSRFENYVVTGGEAKDGHQTNVEDYWTISESGTLTFKENISTAVDKGYSMLYLKDLVNGLALSANCFEVDYMVKTNNAPNGWHGVGFALTDRTTVPNQDGISAFIQEDARKATIWGSGKAGVGGPTEVDSAYVKGQWNFVRVKVFGENGKYAIRMYVNDLTTPVVEVEAGNLTAGEIALFTTTVVSVRDVAYARLDAKGNRIETVYPETITVLNEKRTAEAGETWDIEAKIAPANVTDKGLLYESSNALVATVTGDGKVSFRNAGTVTITVKCSGNPAISESIEITVKEKNVLPTSISFDAVPGADKTVVGGKYTLFVTVAPANATNYNVLFSSSDESVATVDKDGRITFLKAGKVTIKVTAEADSSVKNSIDLVVTGGETDSTESVESTGTGSAASKGCGGSAGGLAVLCGLLPAATLILKKKKK